VLLNAAGAIVAHDVAIRPSPAILGAFPEALDVAARSVDSGAAARTLHDWIRAGEIADGEAPDRSL
jgi:anthranilate phosphoribosyltransferase